ncbi:MAG: 6-phosphogluconolactonase [Candidatus Brocadiia bacterium]
MGEVLRSRFTDFRIEHLHDSIAELAAAFDREEFGGHSRKSFGALAVYVAGNRKWARTAEFFRGLQISYPIRLIIIGQGGEFGFPATPQLRVTCAIPTPGREPFCVEEILLPVEPETAGTLNDISSLSDSDLPLFFLPAAHVPEAIYDGLRGRAEALIIPLAGMLASGREAAMRDSFIAARGFRKVIDLRWPAALAAGRRISQGNLFPVSDDMEVHYSSGPVGEHTAVLMTALLALMGGESPVSSAVPLEEGYAVFRTDGSALVTRPDPEMPKGQSGIRSLVNSDRQITWETPFDHFHIGGLQSRDVTPVRRRMSLSEAFADVLPAVDKQIPEDVLAEAIEIYSSGSRALSRAIFPEPIQAAIACAGDLRATIGCAIRKRGIANIALSGGDTPKLLYAALCEQWGSGIPWEKVHLYFSDERMVPPDHARSNYLLAKIDLIEPLGIKAENIHRIIGEAVNLEEESSRFEREITLFVSAEKAGLPSFDAILLGIGTDGHTASLFPGTDLLAEKSRLVAAAESPTGEKRITMTFPLINAARRVILLACGWNKAAVVKAMGARGQHKADLPVLRLKPRGHLILYMDSAAAGPTETDL